MVKVVLRTNGKPSSQTTTPAATRLGRQPLDLLMGALPCPSAVPTVPAHPFGGEDRHGARARLRRSVSACRSQTPGRGALDGQGCELRVDAVPGLCVGEVEQHRAVVPSEADRWPSFCHQVRGTPSDLRDFTSQQARRNGRDWRSGGSQIAPPPLHRQVQLTVRASLQHGRAMPEPSPIRPKADDPCGVRIEGFATGHSAPGSRLVPALSCRHERDGVREPAGGQQQRETSEEQHPNPVPRIGPTKQQHADHQPGAGAEQGDHAPYVPWPHSLGVVVSPLLVYLVGEPATGRYGSQYPVHLAISRPGPGPLPKEQALHQSPNNNLKNHSPGDDGGGAL